jgi:hypothetical protein
MRPVNRKLLAGILIAFGLSLMGAAVFAMEIGIDNNADWGSRRIVLFSIGFFLFLFGVLFPYFEKLAIPAKGKNSFSRLIGEYGFLLPVALAVLLIYIWFATAGLWVRVPPRREVYSLLAEAFQKQQLHLEELPSEKLLALPNPYDPSQRVGVGEPLDYSLYQGRFYLYWGPAPALILAALGRMGLGNLQDIHLTFGFSYGLFLSLSALVVFMWDHYFSGLPKWILVMAVLLAGLSGPVVWIVCTAQIYEAAIVGGQFFLVAGFFSALLALEKSPASDFGLFFTGVLWALAIGTRLTLVLSIGFMMFMVARLLWRHRSGSFGDFLKKSILLGLPVLLGLAALAWYNWARFGSLTETGFNYQLAGTNLQANDQIFSLRYVIQNFYNYFLAPFQLEPQFPVIFSNGGSIQSILPFYRLPGFYNTNLITGLVFVLPFLFFSIFHLAGRKQVQGFQEKKEIPFGWIINTLSGAALVSLSFLFVFFWAAMRYVLEFSAMLLVVSVAGYFRGYLLAKEQGRERLMAALGISVAAFSILISMTLAISGNIVFFQQANPGLLEWFARLRK